jgi:protoporphyrinogen oxidase
VSDTSTILVLGGGPTGLGAAHELARAGHPSWALFEREAEVGGLARSFRDDHGFTWDVGGHVLFSHYGRFTRVLDAILRDVGSVELERESWVRTGEAWVPYPFQNNVHRLPLDARVACLDGLVGAALAAAAGGARPPADFDEFVARTFGEPIADLFMRPYNEKVWGYPLRELGWSWIGERVAVPDPRRAVRSALLGEDDVSWGPNNRFRFPRRGGTGAIWRALAATLPAERIRCGAEAVALDAGRRTVTFSDGTTRRYDALVSTVPLPVLARMTGVPRLVELAGRLRHSSIHVVGVALAGRPPAELGTKCWMYFPDPDVPFYRVTQFSRYSPENVDDPSRHWSLLAEVCESPHRPVDAGSVAAATVRGLVASGLVESERQVRHTWTHRAEHAYPTPTRDRDELLGELLPALAKLGIWSRGRFGAWKYEVANMDHSYMQGVEVVQHLLHGAAELTVWEPGLVNRPHPALGWDRAR